MLSMEEDTNAIRVMTARERAMRATSVCTGWSNGVSIEKIEREIQAAVDDALEEAVHVATRIGSAPESDYATAAAIAVGITSLKRPAN